jgi:hypothetical protein
MLAFEPLPDRKQPLFLRPVMAVVGSRHGLLDFLAGEEVVRSQRDRMVLARQQRKDVDVVLERLRPVDQPARAGALSQRIVDILRIVGEHAETAIAAHHGRGAGEGSPSAPR